MRSSVVILPEQVRVKVEGFGDGRTGGTAELEPDGFGPNWPGPSGFRAAGARGVRPLGRCPASPFASFLADRRPARETELTTPDLISL
jgi:hypothetical protein